MKVYGQNKYLLVARIMALFSKVIDLYMWTKIVNLPKFKSVAENLNAWGVVAKFVKFTV